MKLTWATFAELLDRGGLLLFTNLFILLLVVGRLETLPRQASSQKIHEHMPK